MLYCYDFISKLPIPPLLEGVEIDGVVNYNLDILEAKHSFFKDVQGSMSQRKQQKYHKFSQN